MNFSEKVKRKTFNTIGLLINRLSQNESGDTTDLEKTVHIAEVKPEKNIITAAGVVMKLIKTRLNVLNVMKS